jgi:hypothetical protein
MTDTWQAGKSYVPGALVKPSSTTVVTQTQPTNGDFETGTLSGWTQGAARWANTSTTPYAGTKCVVLSGTGIDSLNNTNVVPVKPGQHITAQAMAKLTNNGTDDQGAQIIIVWRNAAHAEIPGAALGTLIYGQGGYWKLTSASGTAPVGAAEAFIRLNGNNGTHGGTLEFDQVSWDYAYQAPSPGLIFKATQAAPGKSGTSEPAWPTTAGISVTDNQVTWMGVIASRVVWEASPIMQTGATEPAWPLSTGAIVHDGNMDWVAVSGQVADKNCPHSKVVAIMASKVFAADRDIVRFSATVNPLDWTSAQDAGYLPTGLQQANSNDMAVLAPYRSNLTAFNASSFQNWQVDPDPSAMSLLDQMEGIGSSAQHAAQPVGNELFYLSQLGVRSVGIAAGADSLAAGDVGMPVDVLVHAAMEARPGGRYLATYYPSAGQYWLALPDYLSITGDIADGYFGDVVSYQYHIDSSRSYTVALASGALPVGLSMDATGKVTGTLTGVASYAWSVSATNATSDVYTLPDAAIVKLRTSGIWALLGTGNNTTIDFAASPGSWPLSRTLSTPFNVAQSSPAWNGSAMAVLTATPATSVAIIASQEVPGATVTASVAALPYAYTRIRGFQGIFVAWGDATNGPYAYSSNNGATWTAVAGPSGLILSGISRMTSGRWIAFFRSGATQQLYYSDQATPTSWTLALAGVAGTGNYDIATDGTTAVFTNNINNAYISTDGATWAASGVFSAFNGISTIILSSPIKNVFIAAGSNTPPYGVSRSTDGGKTWSVILLPGASGTVRSMSSHEGVVTAQTAGEEFVSTDYGATWTKPARAPLINAVVAYLGGA